MRFRRDAPVVIIATLVLVIAALTWASNAMFAAQMAEVEAAQFKQMRAILDTSLRAAEDRALARAELVANLPTVRAAFAAGDREKLLAECKDMFAVQRDKHGVDQAQFATLAGISFLRLNAPAKFGEDLSSFRPIIVAVNRDQVARKGMALGRSGPALMGVVPVYSLDDKPLGIFEIGMEFAPILDKLKAAYSFDASFYVKERPLREIATNVSPEVLDEHNRVGEFLKFSSTNSALIKNLVDASDLARVNGDPVQYTRTLSGLSYGVILVALRNAAGESLGIIATVNDFSATRAAAGRALVLQLAQGLLALVLLSGVVLVVIRGFLLRPLAALNQGFEQLRAGSADPLSVPIEALCVELKDLATHYQRLSTQARVGDSAHVFTGKDVK